MRTDWREAALADRHRAMLTYAEKLTLRPSEMEESDVEALRQRGLSEEEILAVVLITGIFNLATRVADALGIPLDPPLTRGTPAYAEFMEEGG